MKGGIGSFPKSVSDSHHSVIRRMLAFSSHEVGGAGQDATANQLRTEESRTIIGKLDLSPGVPVLRNAASSKYAEECSKQIARI